jgi:hypothetical protein
MIDKLESSISISEGILGKTGKGEQLEEKGANDPYEKLPWLHLHYI